MLGINTTNAMGIKKIAHAALNRAIRGAMYAAVREAKVASATETDAVPTIDDYNELVMNEQFDAQRSEIAQGPVGLTRRYSDYTQFMHLYNGLAGELAALQQPWALVQYHWIFIQGNRKKPPSTRLEGRFLVLTQLFHVPKQR